MIDLPRVTAFGPRIHPIRGLASHGTAEPRQAAHYLEIVTHDVDTLVELYEVVHGLAFGSPDPDLGYAYVATRADGSLVGIRRPLSAHEEPIMRTYLAVEDIQQAAGPRSSARPSPIPPPDRERAVFAIVIQGGVEHGLGNAKKCW